MFWWSLSNKIRKSMKKSNSSRALVIVTIAVCSLLFFYKHTTKPDFKNSDIGKCFELKTKTPYLRDTILMVTRIEHNGYHAVSMVSIRDVAIAYPIYNTFGFLRQRYIPTKCPNQILITKEEADFMRKAGTFDIFIHSANVILLK